MQDGPNYQSVFIRVYTSVPSFYHHQGTSLSPSWSHHHCYHDLTVVVVVVVVVMTPVMLLLLFTVWLWWRQQSSGLFLWCQGIQLLPSLSGPIPLQLLPRNRQFVDSVECRWFLRPSPRTSRWVRLWAGCTDSRTLTLRNKLSPPSPSCGCCCCCCFVQIYMP